MTGNLVFQNKTKILGLLLFFLLLFTFLLFGADKAEAVHKCPSDLGIAVANSCTNESHPIGEIDRAASQYCNPKYSDRTKRGKCTIFYKRGALGVKYDDGGQYGAAKFCDPLPVRDCKGAFDKGEDRFKPPGRDNRDSRDPTAGGNVTNPQGAALPAEGPYKDVCGASPDQVELRFNFGCRGEGNPIVDMAYAIIRFLTYGVGLILVASIIYAGIQYSTSEGNPEQTLAAKQRVQNAVIALVFYIFIFALVQFLVPGGLFS